MAPQRSSNRLAARPDLDTKTPQRQRGRDTFEIILATAGELLAEVGFEKLTTNLVCERAGMTPPALYRYFPNKYALLTELAERLMAAQDAAVERFMRIKGYHSRTLEEVVAWNIALRKELIRVTRAQPGGLWILRAIRSVPVLQEVRNASRDKVLMVQARHVAEFYPEVPIGRLKSALRLAEQMAFTAIEMLIEDPLLDEDGIVEEVSWMTALYFINLSDRPPLAPLELGPDD